MPSEITNLNPRLVNDSDLERGGARQLFQQQQHHHLLDSPRSSLDQCGDRCEVFVHDDVPSSMNYSSGEGGGPHVYTDSGVVGPSNVLLLRDRLQVRMMNIAIVFLFG
jgi:hypothetical protein